MLQEFQITNSISPLKYYNHKISRILLLLMFIIFITCLSTLLLYMKPHYSVDRFYKYILHNKTKGIRDVQGSMCGVMSKCVEWDVQLRMAREYVGKYVHSYVLLERDMSWVLCHRGQKKDISLFFTEALNKFDVSSNWSKP